MMSTILGTTADELAAEKSKPVWKSAPLFAWIVVSLSILIGAAILNSIEDEQSTGSDLTPERVAVVSKS